MSHPSQFTRDYTPQDRTLYGLVKRRLFAMLIMRFKRIPVFDSL